MTHKEFLKKLGMEFRVARIRKSLFINDISNMTGLSEAAIGNIENGKSDAKILSYKRMADALEIEMKNFL